MHAENAATIASIGSWIANNWWKVILWVLAGIVALAVFGATLEHIDKKRNPYKYDDFGRKKDFYRW